MVDETDWTIETRRGGSPISHSQGCRHEGMRSRLCGGRGMERKGQAQVILTFTREKKG